MNYSITSTLVMLSIAVGGFAQITFSEHIAPIIFDHCTKCHRQGEIGPFPLTSYSEVAAQASNIEYVTSIRYMPPWRPDHTYSTFRDENWLTDEELDLISSWVSGGTPEGNPDLMPPPPVYPEGSQIGIPDLVLTMDEAYHHLGTDSDQYQIFVLPTGLSEDVDVEAIEVRADNKEICHHAILGLDTTGTAQLLDEGDNEYGYTQFGGFGFEPADQFFSAWVPGANPLVYPPTIGKKLYAGSDLLMQMHYGPSSIDQYDQTSVNIFFADDPVQRYVITYPITPYDLDELFLIPPGQVKTFHGTLNVPYNVSLIGIAPHAHLLCSSYEIYAVSPNEQDTIPLIKIPQWSFNWQGLFAYPNLTLIPAGYTIHCYATYDNTDDNPFNPNDPPAWVTWGEGTEDEMYLCYLQFVLYQNGDEDISLSAANEQNMMVYPKTQLFPSYPNPASDQFTIGFSLAQPDLVNVVVYDIQGKEISRPVNGKNYPPGRFKVQIETADLPSGAYMYRLLTSKENLSQRFIVTR